MTDPRVAHAFARARDYDAHAHVQRRVAQALAARVERLGLPAGARVLEIGCGTGFLGAALLPRLPAARWTMTDIAEPMLARAAARLGGGGAIRFLALDGSDPGAVLGGARFDLVCSSLAAQWFPRLDEAVARQRALLAPGGTLLFATLAEGSFGEWRAAHAAAGAAPGTPDYPPAPALAAMGLMVETEDFVERAASAAAFVRGLKAIGAGTPRPGHRPLAPAALRRVMAAFEEGGAAATYRIAFCRWTAPAR